jgi:hypothetical protein
MIRNLALLIAIFPVAVIVGPISPAFASGIVAGWALTAIGNLVIGVRRSKRVFSMMDADRNGRVSKDEFMNFMSQTFDRLDINKRGVLREHELWGITIPDWVFQQEGLPRMRASRPPPSRAT